MSVLAHCYHPPPHLYRYRCEHGCLRRGFRDLRVWNDVEADCSILNTTPGEVLTGRESSEMTRLGKLVTQHHKGA